MALTLSIHHLPSVPSRELYLLLLSQAGFNTQSAGASAKNLLMSTISHDVTRVRFKAVTDERWVLEPWAEYQIPKFNFYPGTTPPSTSLHEYFRNLTSLAIESHLLSKGVVVRSGGIQTGDIVILPTAGVTHRLLENVESGFLTVESYPAGKDRDICCGKADEQEKIHKIKPSGMV
ncbi:hypothetical protein BKA82DRAFT_832735 [Pisolithus tinctorius]|uniref:Uncharacterized protein n=1 Tax=Pisolithus tinctorius Marx 270 TaxID=870435 RepID=A0A0C3PQ52_PISTI|nr:hypothetical protein BKA82DRAFT_832735 [Pisolithus tinctorius]KIO11101.1 hypothetical protein M404DRAFT_832735 [Pisolithus tinctorius Marx 270]